MATELRNEDILRGWEWYTQHEAHVRKLCKKPQGYKPNLPPSDSDAQRPELWMPGHWRWFLKAYASSSMTRDQALRALDESIANRDAVWRVLHAAKQALKDAEKKVNEAREAFFEATKE